jgi:hypothetical protein
LITGHILYAVAYSADYLYLILLGRIVNGYLPFFLSFFNKFLIISDQESDFHFSPSQSATAQMHALSVFVGVLLLPVGLSLAKALG